MIMAYLYHKKRSPYWYVQYVDSERKNTINPPAFAKTIRMTP
jgi:hypothetical protein